MTGTTGGVEDAEFPRVFLGPRWRFLLRAVLCGWKGKIVESSQLGLATHHLVPSASEGVVGQEPNHISRCEELVANGQLSAIARRLALGAHLAAFIVAVEVLVNPTDGFVFDPNARER